MFKTNILGTPIIVSTDSEVNKVILQNHGNIFTPAYPKSITELLGTYSILRMKGNVQRRLHTIIGAFLRSPQLKAQITKDIQNTVQLRLANWNNNSPLHFQTEAKQVSIISPFFLLTLKYCIIYIIWVMHENLYNFIFFSDHI